MTKLEKAAPDMLGLLEELHDWFDDRADIGELDEMGVPQPNDEARWLDQIKTLLENIEGK